MCRFTIVLNNKYLSLQEIKGILWFSEHSIFKQCYKEPYTPNDDFNLRNHHINLDGFGIGYFSYNNIDKKSHPTIYRNVVPSWNDCNLMQILPSIKTQCMVVHIRAVTPIVNSAKFTKQTLQAPVHTYNCHPFEYGGYIFCHNGLMESFYEGNLRKIIINRISDEILLKIKGTTDSEYIFFLLMTIMKENKNDVHLSIKYLIEFINSLSSTNICSLNIALSDGDNIYITRYINNNEHTPPSLYISDLCYDSVIVSSEPLIKDGCEWKLVDKNQLIHVNSSKKILYHDL